MTSGANYDLLRDDLSTWREAHERLAAAAAISTSQFILATTIGPLPGITEDICVDCGLHLGI